MRGVERIIRKEYERQTLFMAYNNNCLLTSESFGFFSDILVYRSPVSTC